MRILFPLVFFFVITAMFGQEQEKIDSLLNELSKNLDDKTRLKYLTEIFNNYLFVDLDSAKVYKDLIVQLPIDDKSDLISIYSLSSKYYYYKSMPDSSLFYTKKALGMALKLDDNGLKSDLYRKLAILSSRSEDYENAESYGKLALESARKTKDWRLIASSNIMLGNQYYKRTDFDLALRYYLNADSLYTLNNTEDRFLANSYDNISSIYTDLKDEKALDYIERSKIIYQNIKDEEGIAYTNLLKGTYYNKIEAYSEAINSFRASIAFYGGYGNISRLLEAQTRLINAYSGMGDYKNAEKTLLNAEKVLKKSEEQTDFIGFYLNAGQLNIDIKKYDRAISYFKTAESLISDTEYDYTIAESREIKKGLTDAYLGKKDYQNALKYSQLHLQISDSIFAKNNLEITRELETKYQTQKKEQEIALLKAENELSIQQKANQRTLFMAGGSLLGLLSLGLFFLYRNKQKTHQRLKELDTMKSNFFANISHEFRTPLTLISGPLQNRLEQPTLADKDRDELHMMLNNSKQLTSLVDQLLDLSKIEAGSLQLQVQQGNALKYIAGLAANFEHAVKQKGITFLTNINHDDAPIWYDSDALSKITTNLLSNAMKFTPKKGSVLCNAHIAGGKLHLSVKNTGEGLTDDEQKKVFDRFYQTAHNQKGTGIGLALVKELVALYHGSISVESIPDEWTCFSVVLPTSIKALGHANADAPDLSLKDEVIGTPINTVKTMAVQSIDTDSEQPVMLIVEDNHDLRQLLKNNFETTYQVLLAKDGVEGVAMAIEHIPEIIIADVMMPKKDGMALTQQLKQDERTSHIPIILLTAKASEQSKIEGLEFKADDYITKPFNQKILATRINNLIETRKALQKRYSQEVILRPMDIAVTPPDQRFLEKVQAVLDQKLIESDFSVEEFSTAVGMSRMQLHRKLKALTGLSATEFVRSQRLKLAAQLLKKSEINVSQVGYSVGFNDHSYFTKCFKELYKCTPSEYAKRDWG